ncbi:hypothetical protein DID88_000930 [Monilinia fructigena]|uniref:NACHT domain-containing protein n=1 Tax=Monilinia fructigena TaxID=38457 RepID=A0A395IYN0_9HELO|nr:hypothetical protein DID88_000930 [Monilinia fructigena]
MEAIGTISNIAGILSAGIQVCEGLVNYYTAWKGSKKENVEMIKSMKSLLTNFALLKGVLQSPSFDEAMAITVESNILDCEDSIAELRDELKKAMVCKPSRIDEDDFMARKSQYNHGFRDKMTEQSRRILYPFRKSTLMRLQESVDHVRGNLVFAMDILNLSTIATTAEKVIDISKQVTTIGDSVDAIITKQMDEEGIKILNWLSAIDCHSKQREVLSQRQVGTGEWLFESQEYQDWLDGKGKLLWCSGSPGAGKTVLTSAIVENLQTMFSASNVGVAFIYCNYAEKIDVTAYLTSVIQQLIRQRYAIPKYVLDLYHEHTFMGRHLNKAEATHLLHSLISEFTRLYLVVDALDECDETKKIRTDLIHELRALPSNTHVLLTSRRLGDIEEKLSGYPHLEIRASDNDVQKYLEARIDREENILKFCKKDPTLRKTIVGKIAEKAHGMFLLVHLHIEAIASELKISRVRKALNSLPEILDKTYDDALKRIAEGQDANRKSLAMNILMWLSCAKRPLTVCELQHAMAITELDPDENELDEDDFYDQDLLLTVCAGLVVIEPDSGVIRLCHSTLQEYLERHRARFFPNAQVLITRACIRYLSLDSFKEYALFSYATKYLGSHAQGTAEIELREDILYFLNQRILANRASAVVMRSFGFKKAIEFTPPIVAAAIFGLPETIKTILRSGADIESTCSRNYAPLLVAAEFGHSSVVSALILSKANPLARDDLYENSLHKAARKGHTKIVRKLISAYPYLIDVPAELNRTALHIAIERRHEAVVKALIEAGANINFSDKRKLTPLMKAAVTNLPKVVHLLVENGANIDAKGFANFTALSLAAASGNFEAVKKLLGAGADVDAGKDNFHFTALTAAVACRCKNATCIVDEIIRFGADVNVVYDTETVLMYCVSYPPIIKLLIKAGANLEAKDRDEETVLHKAVKANRDDSVRILLEAGADLQGKNYEGKTALDLAKELKHTGQKLEIINLLMAAMTERSNHDTAAQVIAVI